jgi:peptidase M1-like protein
MKTIILSLVICSIIIAQESDLYVPINIQNAYTNQTRSADGNPGKNYWQNSADYKMNVEIDPVTGLMTGSEKIVYFNNSPDTLNELYIHLFMNIYKKGNPREYAVDPSDENEGVIIESLSVNGKEVNESSMEYIHNDFILQLEEPLISGQNTKLDIFWNYTINRNSHFRTGQVDSTSWFVAYFFPRIAVYDDIDGWNNFKYSGSAEFYNDFGNFDISITVPQNFVVWATGMLQNPEQVLKKKYAARLSAALTSDKIIHIIDSTECTSNLVTRTNEKNTWQFQADNVNDFAFAISDHYLWDASSLVVDQDCGRRVLIDAAYNKHSKDFYKVAKIARQSIEYMSNEIPGVPFPYPNETIFNGLDEMEYPMMVNNLSTDDSIYSVKVTAHEIFHSYMPFYMGINETKYAWMDEGFASFCDYLILSELHSERIADFYYLESYQANAGFEVDVPIITNSKHLTRPMYHYNAYAKPAAFLYVLKDLLGNELFVDCLQEFMKRWNGKHPIPYDFFYTLNYVSDQNLNWLFKPWFFEFGYVDMAITNIENESCTIEKIGLYPAPVHLKIFYDDGSSKMLKRNAAVWKDGSKEITIKLPYEKTIKKIELIHRLVPDADVLNNIYEF